jgi:uncharacterized protein YabN with tetrapyrrole methylase and pyrophosphatase domain
MGGPIFFGHRFSPTDILPEQAPAFTCYLTPPHLPPLLMALRLQERAAGVGFDWPDENGPQAKVREEMAELEEVSREASDRERMAIELGDLFFAAVNLSRKLGVDPNQALEIANEKFRWRFEAVERIARERGVEVGEATLDELDTLWEEVKEGT